MLKFSVKHTSICLAEFHSFPYCPYCSVLENFKLTLMLNLTQILTRFLLVFMFGFEITNLLVSFDFQDLFWDKFKHIFRIEQNSEFFYLTLV